MKVTYTKTAIKALAKIPTHDRNAIMDKMKDYAAGGSQDVKPLKGPGKYLRLRHGDWRAIFTESGKVIAVQNVAKRGEAYR